MLVDHGIHFHHLEAEHAAVIGDDLHGEMRFAVSGAAPHGGAHAGRIFRIHPIHIERDVITGGTAAGNAQGLFHDGPHAALVNIAHGVHLDARAADVFLLDQVYVAHPDHDAVVRRHLGAPAVQIGEFRRTQAHDGGQGHAVHVAAGRTLRRVDVAVRVHPDQADFLPPPAVEL